MIQTAIEKAAEKYSGLPSHERREKLKSVKKWESYVSALSLLLIIGTRRSEHGVVQSLFMTFTFSGIHIEYLLFPLLLLVEVAIARTAKNSVPLVTLLFTSIMAAAVTYGYLFYYIIYSLVFIYFEIQLIAMKAVPGYPLFEDEKPAPRRGEMPPDIFAYSYESMRDAAENMHSAENEDTEQIKQTEELSTDGLDLDSFFEASSRGSTAQMDEIVLPENYCTEDNDDTETN